MAYETKVVLSAIAQLVKARAKGQSDKGPFREIYNDILAIANVEGVVLEPFDENE